MRRHALPTVFEMSHGSQREDKNAHSSTNKVNFQLSTIVIENVSGQQLIQYLLEMQVSPQLHPDFSECMKR